MKSFVLLYRFKRAMRELKGVLIRFNLLEGGDIPLYVTDKLIKGFSFKEGFLTVRIGEGEHFLCLTPILSESNDINDSIAKRIGQIGKEMVYINNDISMRAASKRARELKAQLEQEAKNSIYRQ